MKRNSESSPKKKKKRSLKVAKIFYLNELMDVASRNIVEGHTRKGLQILGSNNLMSSVHHQTLVIPNGG